VALAVASARTQSKLEKFHTIFFVYPNRLALRDVFTQKQGYNLVCLKNIVMSNRAPSMTLKVYM
tara:strand:- start:35 stop:226 length:192 start_codon:yes stop_codon:yes gene_type:complete